MSVKTGHLLFVTCELQSGRRQGKFEALAHFMSVCVEMAPYNGPHLGNKIVIACREHLMSHLDEASSIKGRSAD